MIQIKKFSKSVTVTKIQNQSFYWSILAICASMGVKNMSVGNKYETIEAIIKMQSYLGGYSKPQITTKWFLRKYYFPFESSVLNSPIKLLSLFSPVPQPSNKQENYIDYIQSKFPGYLHSLYRYATRVLGNMANARSIINLMNERSSALHPSCPIRSDLRMTKHHFWRFFYQFGGKLLNHTTKPRLTLQHMTTRIHWARTWRILLSKASLSNFPVYYCFLDEKCFFTVSRRKKSKFSPGLLNMSQLRKGL